MGLTENVAEISLIAEHGRLATGLRASLGLVKDFVSGASGHLAKLSLAPKDAKKGQSVIAHAAGQVLGNVAMRGLDMMVEQTKKVFDFNEALERFGISAKMPERELPGLAANIRHVSNETGMAADEILRGARAFTDLAGASAFTQEKMALMARVSQASEAATSDLAEVMFQLQRNMKVSDADLEGTFGGLINIGKEGAVEFKHMAMEISELAPQAARYGMVGRKGANELSALMQVARTGFGSVSEMGTGITRVFVGLTMHASKFRKYGVEVFNTGKDGTKTWRKFSDIFNDIRTNNILAKDPELLRKAFGRSEADRTIRLWMEGVETLKQLEAAGEANGVVQQDLGRFTTSSAGRMHIAFEKMKNAFAEALTPERVDQIVGGIQRIAESIGPLVTATGKAFDGIAKIVHLIGRAKQHLQGDSRWETSGGATDEERRLMTALRMEQAGKMVYWDDKDRQRAKRLTQHAKDYDQAMGEIMGAEDDFGPTDDSIKRALRYSRSHDMSPQGQNYTEAGRSYLISRDKEISDERYKRLRDEVDKERAEANPAAETMRRVAEIEEADKRKAREQAAFAKEHIAPIVRNAVDMIARAIQGKPTEVKVDGNPVAKAGNNATDQRRR